MIAVHTSLWLALALLVPALTIGGSAGPLRAELGLLPAPFAWPGILVVHLLAALPVGFVLARSLQRLSLGLPSLGGVVGAAFLAVIVYATGPAFGALLDACQAGWMARTLFRVVVCLLLETPWLLLAIRSGAIGSASAHQIPDFVSVLVAIVVPTAYAWHVIDQQTRRAEEAVQAQRLPEVHAVTWGLCDLGSTESIGGIAPQLLLRQSAEMMESLRHELAIPLATDASPRARMDRARKLAVLNQLDASARLVEPFAPTDPDATLLLALIRQTQARFAESDALYQTLLDQDHLPTASRTDLLTRACDGLAFNARAQKHFTKAQGIYEDALRRLPEAQAHFHFQLGRHFHQAGRFADAETHLSRAATLDAARHASAAAALLRELRQHSPACMLRR